MDDFLLRAEHPRTAGRAPLRKMLRQVAALPGVSAAAVYAAIAENSGFHFLTGADWPAIREPDHPVVARGLTADPGVLRGRPVYFEGRAMPRWAAREWRSFRAMGVAPVVWRKKLLAVLVILSREAAPFSPALRRALRAHTRQLAALLIAWKLEERLRANEIRFRLITHAISEAFYIFDPRTAQNVYFDREGYRALYRRDPAFVRHPVKGWQAAIHPADRERVVKGYQRSLRGARIDLTYRIHWPDGRLRWMRSRIQPAHDRRGRLCCIVGTVSDVTRRKEAEARLDWNLRAERWLADLSRRVTVARDLEHAIPACLENLRVFLACDRVWLNVLNSRPDPPLLFNMAAQRPDLPALNDDHFQPASFPWLVRRLARGRFFHCPDVRLLPPAAALEIAACRRMRTRAFHIEPLVYHGGYRGALILCQADTPRVWTREERQLVHSAGQLLVNWWEHQRADRALRISEERFRRVVKEAADAIFLMDARGRFLHANPAGCRLLKRSLRRLQTLTMADLLASQAMPLDPIAADAARIRGRAHRHQFRCGDGTVRLCEARARRMPDGRIVTILRDVTERGRMERRVLDAITREQQRIGRDLHDTIGQQLTGLAYEAEALRRKLADRSLPEAAQAVRVCDRIRQAAQVARHLAHGLTPMTFHPEGLESALRVLADETGRTFSMTCACNVNPQAVPADTAMQLHLYQIACEAVNNAVKHDAPRRLAIELTRSGDVGRLAVRHQGRAAVKAGNKSRRSMGLAGMHYRAEAIGGECRIICSSHGLWDVICTYPLQALNGSGRIRDEHRNGRETSRRRDRSGDAGGVESPAGADRGRSRRRPAGLAAID